MMVSINNPIRYSIKNRTEGVGYVLGEERRVTEIDVRPSEGNIYVHWENTNES
jgi:hypothetical protein